MTALWPEAATRVPLGDSPEAPFALHHPAQAQRGKRPVLLIHGFRGTSADWGPLAERLARTRDVWAPDLITPSGSRGMPAVHDLLDRVRAETGGGPVDVIASSMGGYVATSWASTAGDVVASLTLLAPALVDLQPLWRVPGFTRLLSRTSILDIDEKRWAEGLITATSATVLERDTPHHLSLPEDLRQAVLEHGRDASTNATARGRKDARQQIVIDLMATLRRSRGISSLLTKVRVPVLWLHGTDDPLVPFGPSREVARQLADCTFVPLEGVGHIPHLECPDLVTERFTSFVGA